MVLGESATLDDAWDVTVQDPDMDATQAVVDEGNSEPSDGNIYVMVYITATNTGSEPAQVYDNIAMRSEERRVGKENGSAAQTEHAREAEMRTHGRQRIDGSSAAGGRW